MHRCFDLARHGGGKVSPNPLVGSVIVHNEQIIGEGFHTQFGQAHAEVNAVNAVVDQQLLQNATLYVNLEPCAHFGKTPPCASLIIDKKIPRVVIANRDPFARVDGKGIEMLRTAGVDVITGLLEKEGAWLNRRFFTFHREKRPYIILKFAQSANGFMDRLRKPDEKGINWITTRETQYLTHSWRSEEDAILIGSQTALIDNPSLTVRRVNGKSPHRLLIDRNLTVSENNAVYKGPTNTTVFNALRNGKKDHITFVQLDFLRDVVPQILKWAHHNNLQSILVEGGARTLSHFLTSELWDEARILTGSVIFDGGIPAPMLKGDPITHYLTGTDRINVIRRAI